MSNLSQHFEKLDKAIDSLEGALQSRIETLEARVEEAELSNDNEIDNSAAVEAVDKIISKVERLIETLEE